MAKKKELPGTLTHTEILCLAIRCCEHDIHVWESDPLYHPEYVKTVTEPCKKKLEALRTLYRLETGTEY